MYARNVRTGETVRYRAGERFAMCSVFKGLAAAHVLRDYDHCGRFLDRVVHYTEADLLPSAVITRRHVDTGMTVRALCAAAIRYSDGTAGNLLLRETDGPRGLTRFCRSIGDAYTRLDRWEPDLTTAIPGDLRDTTTPEAIGRSFGLLIVGRSLSTDDRRQFSSWLKGNTTSANRFHAGLPDDWVIADKTGSGDYATANDVGVVWTSKGTPLVLSVMTSKDTKEASRDEELIANTARVLARTLAPGE